MTHTPGPWNRTIVGVCDRDGNDIAHLWDLHGNPMTGDAVDDNCDLIAASPALFAACEALVAWADEVGWDNTGEPKEFEMARAAIAQAKGETK